MLTKPGIDIKTERRHRTHGLFSTPGQGRLFALKMKQMQLAADSPVNLAKIYHSLPTLQNVFLRSGFIADKRQNVKNKVKAAWSVRKKMIRKCQIKAILFTIKPLTIVTQTCKTPPKKITDHGTYCKKADRSYR